MVNFTIGCDPEIFLMKKDGSPLSAHGAVEGTKKAPKPVTGGAIQVDGMALEFNTEPVILSDSGFSAFNENINSVLKELKAAVAASEGFKTARFKIAPVQDFGEETMANTPDEAKELGCDPDYCAYTAQPNPRPDGEVTFRTASGHIHVGWGSDIPIEHPDHIKICCDFIKCLDAHVGLFMTIIESDPRRRELYGKAGAFRPKPYGVEYRTPSNEWLLSVANRRTIYTLVDLATKTMRNYGTNVRGQFVYFEGGKVVKWATEAAFYEMVRSVIDSGDKEAAYKLLMERLRNGWMERHPVHKNIVEAYKKATSKKAA